MRSDRGSLIRLLAFVITTVVVIAADLISKQIIIDNMRVGDSIALIPGLLNITYVQNSGAAFGMLSEHRWVFLVLSVLILGAILVFALFRGFSHRIYAITLGMIAGGGVGNMIERVRLGYVTDFIDFVFLPFWKWVFNIADACVCVGAFILIIYIIVSDIKKGKNGKDTPDRK